MAAHVLACVAENKDKPALEILHSDRVETWSYGDIEKAVLGIASGLLEHGLNPGERILCRLGNTPLTPLAYLAAIAVDLIPVPLSSQLTASEVAGIIADISPTAILQADSICKTDEDITVFSDLLSEWQHLPPAPFRYGDPDRPAYIVYTSGTSGRPQAVQHAHRAIWARKLMITDWYDLRPTDRLLHAGAFNWTYTMGTGLMDPWSIGATSLVPAPELEAKDLPAKLRAHKATIFAAVPGVYRKILMSDNSLELPDIRHGLSAGEKMSPHLKERWNAATGTQVHEAFGMSECSTFISSHPGRKTPDNSLGQPQHGRKVAILDHAGRPVPRNQIGTIAVHKSDPGLMLGYVNAPQDTTARFNGDWFLTGDLGEMTPSDEVIYHGRNDDIMNAGGYRVSPVEVEAALANFPGLDAIGVTDIEVKIDVRVIIAFYTSDAPIDIQAMKIFAQKRLAHYKTPRAYLRVTELPTGPNGKLRRAALKTLWTPND